MASSIFHFIIIAIPHIFNFVFMCVEAALNRLSMVRPYAIFCIVYGNTYIGFSWFQFLLLGEFRYFFVDWRSMFTPLWYIALCGLLFLFFFIAEGHFIPRLKRGIPPDMLPSLDNVGHDVVMSGLSQS